MIILGRGGWVGALAGWCFEVAGRFGSLSILRVASCIVLFASLSSCDLLPLLLQPCHRQARRCGGRRLDWSCSTFLFLVFVSYTFCFSFCEDNCRQPPNDARDRALTQGHQLRVLGLCQGRVDCRTWGLGLGLRHGFAHLWGLLIRTLTHLLPQHVLKRVFETSIPRGRCP